MQKTILIVDDEKDIIDLLSYNLSSKGYNVITAGNGAEALLKVNSDVDLILLDVMMPKMNGYDVCKSVRNNPTSSDIPIILLTAKSSTSDEYEGLACGADDYIVKPVSIKNLLLRINNIFKRLSRSSKESQVVSYSSISVDSDRCAAFVLGKQIRLTKTELSLLLMLIRSPGKVFRREEILNKIWGEDTFVTDRTIDVHIRKLRAKIEKEEKIIRTSHGLGYYVDKK